MKTKKLLVVLYAQSFDQCMTQADIILAPGCAHGLLVVNNGLHVASQPQDSAPSLFNIAIAIKKKFPDHLVGINPLDMKNFDALFEFKKTPLDILYVNDGGINEVGTTINLHFKVTKELEDFDFGRQHYFGCIYSPYQTQITDMSGVAKIAAQRFRCVVIGTEGFDEGPSLDKILEARRAVNVDTTIIGIARGINIKNLRYYLPFADFFIVGTSLLVNRNDPFIYDGDLIKQMRSEIDRFQDQSGHIC